MFMCWIEEVATARRRTCDMRQLLNASLFSVLSAFSVMPFFRFPSQTTPEPSKRVPKLYQSKSENTVLFSRTNIWILCSKNLNRLRKRLHSKLEWALLYIITYSHAKRTEEWGASDDAVFIKPKKSTVIKVHWIPLFHFNPALTFIFYYTRIIYFISLSIIL